MNLLKLFGQIYYENLTSFYYFLLVNNKQRALQNSSANQHSETINGIRSKLNCIQIYQTA